MRLLRGRPSTLALKVWEALDNAEANGYPHDYERTALETAEGIHDWSGLTAYDPENLNDQTIVALAVEEWRNKQKEKRHDHDS
jgi:hypothetical protein